MFTNQTYKQNLSFSQNHNNNNVVKIGLAVTTNHEIDKTILKDIETVISTLFLTNYVNTDDLLELHKKEKELLKQQKLEDNELLKKEKELLKQKEKDEKERIRLQELNDLKNELRYEQQKKELAELKKKIQPIKKSKKLI